MSGMLSGTREPVDVVVVGAGVVGLAVAAALAGQGREVIVLESEHAFGSATSARHSEVLHAGLYYEPGSWKARLCVQGRAQLVRYLAERGVAHRLCGKLVVATEAQQLLGLDAIEARARACGVHDLRRLDGGQAMAMEPGLQAVGALWSPSTGIVDSHGLMLALVGDIEARGGWLALRSPVERMALHGDGIDVDVGGEQPLGLTARSVVNCAGLHAQTVAASIEGLDRRHVPARFWARGHYFSLPGRAPFSRLIYPLPEPGGLGIHATLDLGGQMRFGPDVQWIDPASRGREDYRVDAGRRAAFEDSIRRYWPDLPDAVLQADYAGIRPKLSGPGQPAADFCLQGPPDHGVAGLVNLFGIESPGLTSSLALGAQVAAMLASS